jgi:hypothetical protein
MKNKPYAGETDGYQWFVNVEGVNNAFPESPFGRRLDDIRTVEAWKAGAQHDWVSTKESKGQHAVAEVKRWIKATKPREWYCKFQPQSDSWSADSVEIWFKL